MTDHLRPEPQTYDEAMALALEWAHGTRSHWNTYCGMSDDRPAELAQCAVADAQEVVKWTAYAVALAQGEAIRHG